MSRKEAVSLSMGDRNSPLEADIQADATTLHPQVEERSRITVAKELRSPP